MHFPNFFLPKKSISLPDLLSRGRYAPYRDVLESACEARYGENWAQQPLTAKVRAYVKGVLATQISSDNRAPQAQAVDSSMNSSSTQGSSNYTMEEQVALVEAGLRRMQALQASHEFWLTGGSVDALLPKANSAPAALQTVPAKTC